MRLLDRTTEAGERVDKAKYEVDLALLHMAAVLDRAQTQLEKAKEELSERRASGEASSGA